MRKPLISRAEMWIAGLTLCATSQGDWQCGLHRGGLACACANRTWIAVDLPRPVTSSREVCQSPRPSRSWRKKSSSSCMSCSGLKSSSRRGCGASAPGAASPASTHSQTPRPSWGCWMGARREIRFRPYVSSPWESVTPHAALLQRHKTPLPRRIRRRGMTRDEHSTHGR